VDRPWWWLLLLFIPLVKLVFAVILCIDLAKAFGDAQYVGAPTH
jgi:signal peptidase I